MKVLIIGGVAGGASAAARLRRLREDAEIVVIERSGYVSYANCGLPYYIGGDITDRGKLTLQTPQSFKNRFNVDVRVLNEALSIDRAGKIVRIRSLETGEEYEESYDSLILSPGARPMIPDVPGIDGERMFTLRTVEDTFAIDEFISANAVESAIIVGAGFIGLEMAENLLQRGLSVKIVQRSMRFQPLLDADMAAILRNHMASNGVEIHMNSPIVEYRHQADCVEAVVEGGEIHKAGIVIIAAGVQPDTVLAREAGLELGVKGAIVVDDHMRTSDPSIYAVGDAIQVKNLVTGADANIPLAGPANKQGRIAADNIAGIDRVYRGSQGSAIMKAFEMTAASTGPTSKQLEDAGIDFDSVVIFPPSHATYYPGAHNMTLKVMFAKDDGRILAAQIVGFDGVDKRIDVLATAIRSGLTAYDLTELELAYAPPYSSAKDPVNMVGFVMENVLTGIVGQVHWDEALAADEESTFLLDVRTVKEYERGHIDRAVNIPVDELRGRMGELDKSKKLIVICQSALRSYIACRILSQNGFDCVNVAGGYGFYKNTRTPESPSREVVGPCGA
ncbi:MAG: FAD-dependent oxidoreductase [Coriobacteriales bacterium]|jgi:NADPH-dependent 2,4-dienoyl-CoA reductase/sulfur reductase-like enzyme/rhodanese-related sulfurtransferase